MGFWQLTKKTAGHIVNVRADQWIDFEGIKKSFCKTLHFTKKLVDPSQPIHIETFEAALRRLDLSEKDLKQKETQFFRLFVMYIILSMSVFFYSIVLLILYHNYFGFLMGLALTLYASTRSFYYHFWLFQIRQKKLGCSLRDWWYASFHKYSSPTRKN